MKVEILPTCEIAAGYRTHPMALKTPHIRVSVWLSLDLVGWGEHREGHLHMIRDLEGGPWRRIDLSRHPMSAVSDDTPVLTGPVIDEIREELRREPLRFYRAPDLGAVSELGEDDAAFRRRILGVLRPVVQQRIDGREGEGRDASDLATQISRLANSIEEFRCDDVWSHVKRVEIGILLIPGGMDLTSANPRDPAIQSP